MRFDLLRLTEIDSDCMNPCCRFELDPSGVPQRETDRSFIGGLPRLPPLEAIPKCRLCGAEQAFFFQVEFPEGTAWSGRTLAVFSCVFCASEDFLIPEMLDGPLRGVDIPEGFLEAYQRNFRFLVFPVDQCVVRRDYVEKVRFIRMQVLSAEDAATLGNKLGGNPHWILEDETPGTYAGEFQLTFLLQLEQGLEFPTVEGAPPQIEIALDGTPAPAERSHYELLIGNALYLFGVEERGEPLVYAITQAD